MPRKSNHSFKEKYPYGRAGTLVSIRNTDNISFGSFWQYKMTHNDVKFSKDVELMIVVDKLLHSLIATFNHTSIFETA